MSRRNYNTNALRSGGPPFPANIVEGEQPNPARRSQGREKRQERTSNSPTKRRQAAGGRQAAGAASSSQKRHQKGHGVGEPATGQTGGKRKTHNHQQQHSQAQGMFCAEDIIRAQKLQAGIQNLEHQVEQKRQQQRRQQEQQRQQEKQWQCEQQRQQEKQRQYEQQRQQQKQVQQKQRRQQEEKRRHEKQRQQSQQQHYPPVTQNVPGVAVSSSSSGTQVQVSHLFKFIIIGSGQVGKTCMLLRFTDNR